MAENLLEQDDQQQATPSGGGRGAPATSPQPTAGRGQWQPQWQPLNKPPTQSGAQWQPQWQSLTTPLAPSPNSAGANFTGTLGDQQKVLEQQYIKQGLPPDVAQRHARQVMSKYAANPSFAAPVNDSENQGVVANLASGVGKEAAKTVVGATNLVAPSLTKGGDPAALETHGVAQGLGSLAEQVTEFAGGEAALSGLVKLAKTPAALLELMEKYPKATKTILALAEKANKAIPDAAKLTPLGEEMVGGAAKSAVVGGAQGALKGAEEGDAVKGAETGAEGGAIGGGLSALMPGGLTILPKSKLNAAEKEAVEFGIAKKIPVDAGTASGNPVLKRVQQTVDDSLFSGGNSAEARNKTAQALTKTGGEIAEGVSPAAQVPESAGAGARAGLNEKIASLKKEANTAYNEFRSKSGSTPVDVSQIKKDLTPLVQNMDKWMEPAKRQASAGYQALKSIVEGSDTISADDAEAGLSGFKSLARQGSDNPNLANINQGLGKTAAKKLQSAIDDAVGKADPDALKALQKGREVVKEKYGIASTLEALRDEPVQAFNQLTMAKDAGIDQLRKVAKVVPDEMPKLGRAYLDDMLTKATAEGGFDKAGTLLSKWNNLGPETKKIIFPNAQHVQDLDNFFLLAKKLSENPNPSGTARSLFAAVQGGLILHNPITGVSITLGNMGLSKLLHSPAGAKAALEGLKFSVPGEVRAASRAASAVAFEHLLSEIHKSGAEETPQE